MAHQLGAERKRRPELNAFGLSARGEGETKQCHYAPSYSARGGGRDKTMPILPENVIAKNVITSS